MSPGFAILLLLGVFLYEESQTPATATQPTGIAAAIDSLGGSFGLDSDQQSRLDEVGAVVGDVNGVVPGGVTSLLSLI